MTLSNLGQNSINVFTMNDLHYAITSDMNFTELLQSYICVPSYYFNPLLPVKCKTVKSIKEWMSYILDKQMDVSQQTLLVFLSMKYAFF